MILPEKYTEEMKSLLKNEYDDYLAAMDQPYVRSIRINTLKISPEEFMKISPFDLTPVPWCREGFYVNEDERPGTHPYYYAGLYYIQEASAMIPAAVLPVREHDAVLDLCAAPGGKSTYLASRLNGTGVLAANDISASRQNATLKNLERFGAGNIYVLSEDPEKLAGVWPEKFDCILLDAPCSGEGMFRKDPSLIKAWEKRGSEEYVPVQKKLAEQAVKMLKPGGYLVYSTCTFSVCEDEEIIRFITGTFPEMKLQKIPDRHESFMPGVLPGFEDCIRLYPHKLNGEGHFTALLKKDGISAPSEKYRTKIKIPAEAEEFMRLLKYPLPERITVRKDKVLLLPEISLPSDSLRVIRSGLLLGTLKKGRFEPSQALSFALSPETFGNCISLAAGDPRVIRCLRGETLQDDSDTEGNVLVCIDRWPLCFGKKQKNTIKNRIEKGYRML